MHAIKVGASGYGNVVAEAKREDGFKSKVGTIDETKTKDNYGLVDRPAPKNIDEHIRELGVKRKIRADAVRMCSVIIDYPKDETRSEREFFQSAVDGLKEHFKIDDKALLYAEVHVDEGHSHMHVGFVPLTEKKKKYKDGREEMQVKLSAKDVLTKQSLEELHPFMVRYMSERGFTGTLLHEDGVKRDKDFMEHKLEKMNEEYADLKERIGIETDFMQDVLDQNNEMCGKLNDLQDEISSLTEQRERLVEDVEGIKAYKRTLTDEIKPLEDAVDALKGDRLTLMERFINNPKIKPIFDKFCTSIREQINAHRQEQREKFTGMSMSEWKAGINQARANAPGAEHRTSAKHKDEWER